ncbi:MAG: ATP-binding protein [Methylococcales bacterium]|nr:ATP-binding protein [Methylococcales bacterium]
MTDQFGDILLDDSWLLELAAFITDRIDSYFSEEHVSVVNRSPSYLTDGNLLAWPLRDFFQQRDLSSEAQVLVLIALAPHLDADFYDRTIQGALPRAGDFPKIGGSRGKSFRGFLPTGETALFLLAGKDAGKRIELHQLFSENHLFVKEHILWLEEVPEGEPRMSGRIIISQDFVELFTTGQVTRPRFSINFPAELLETELEWDDLVLNDDSLEQTKELQDWVRHGETLMNDWEMRRKLKPGYRALFHGPPGTGKTLTASLLGKYTGRDVYRVDLSAVVSKYIGETEKNLANLFSRANNKNWILFFDEADALFGKRTSVRDAHDKYANQEVSYLLQRLEHYNGLVILATNIKSNIDDAFSRRFQSIVYFPMPGANERLLLWKKAFPERVQRADDIDFTSLAQKYELTGAAITNIVQYACLRSLARGEDLISYNDLYKGIKRELAKEGRILR